VRAVVCGQEAEGYGRGQRARGGVPWAAPRPSRSAAAAARGAAAAAHRSPGACVPPTRCAGGRSGRTGGGARGGRSCRAQAGSRAAPPSQSGRSPRAAPGAPHLVLQVALAGLRGQVAHVDALRHGCGRGGAGIRGSGARSVRRRGRKARMRWPQRRRAADAVVCTTLTPCRGPGRPHGRAAGRGPGPRAPPGRPPCGRPPA
jgi:hypothetical protein